VQDGVLVARLTARRQCSQCMHIYNRLSQPPHVEGRCDIDGAPLIKRADDEESVILDRLRAYRELTGPILGWYGASNIRTVDGSLSPDRVKQAIEQAVLQTAGLDACAAQRSARGLLRYEFRFILGSMKMGERGQVTVPKEIRDRFGLGPETDVEFQIVNGSIVLKKAAKKLDIRKWKGRCGRNFSKLGYSSVDEFIDGVRGR
jgi:AbrB family looped-hinge helix DNA binding protein